LLILRFIDVPPFTIYISPDWDSPIGDIQFSKCGRYIVIEMDSTAMPEIRQIDPILLQAASDTVDRVGGSGDEKAMITITPATGPVVNAPVINLPTVMRGGMSLITGDGKVASLNIVHTSNEISIRLWEWGDEQSSKEDVIQLTKLPNWSQLSTGSVSIGMPGSDNDGSIRVVLNKAAKPWENMDDDMDTQLPALVSRDVRTLQYSVRGGRSLHMGAEVPQLDEGSG
jgi:hypothetical protein